MRRRQSMAAAALFLGLLLGGCGGPYSREMTNTSRSINGSSVIDTGSIEAPHGEEKAGKEHGGEEKPKP